MDVIIPTKNSAAVLGDCLKSLRAQRKYVNIIIVDANSTDKTLDLAKLYECQIYTEPPSNVKGSRRAIACNEGLRHSRSDLVAFLDSDTIIPEDWSLNMEHYFVMASRSVAGITSGCEQLDTPTSKIMSMGSPNHAKKFASCTRLTSLPGYNAVYRRSAIDKVGAFSEDIGGCEDFELNHRLLKARYMLIGVPYSPVIHKEREDINSFGKQIHGYAWSRARLLKTKHIFNPIHILPPLSLLTILTAAALLYQISSLATGAFIAAFLFVTAFLFMKFPYYSLFIFEWSEGYIKGLFD